MDITEIDFLQLDSHRQAESGGSGEDRQLGEAV